MKPWPSLPPLRSALAAGALFASVSQAAADPSLIEPPTGLQWSAREVQAAAEPALQALLARAGRDALAGCARRCAQFERVFARLRGAMQAQGGRAASLDWQLVVVRLPDEQALALPEGQILVSEVFVEARGLDDAALAFVIAHEMAHAVLEHERQTLTYALALLPREVPRTVRDMYTEMAWDGGFLRRLAPISHQVELEADELGLLLAAAAGYAPRRQMGFMAGELALEAGTGAEPSGSHPAAVLRLRQLQALLPLAERLHARAGTDPD